jgi:hypothetical protein
MPNEYYILLLFDLLHFFESFSSYFFSVYKSSASSKSSENLLIFSCAIFLLYCYISMKGFLINNPYEPINIPAMMANFLTNPFE